MTRTLLSRVGLGFAALMASAACWAAAADNVSAVGPFVRLMPPGAPATGAFMVLKNDGDQDVKLVKAATPAAHKAELHDHIMEGGMMKMRQIPAITIKAKSSTVLKPGSLHVMLIDLTAPLQEGGKVPITLGFEDGSSKTVEAMVMKPVPAADMPMGKMPMDHNMPMDHGK